MIKASKFTLDPGEAAPQCGDCHKDIFDELAETSIKPGYFHVSCAIDVELCNDPTDHIAFIDDAREYAKSKGE
jgi:hypothetical protein